MKKLTIKEINQTKSIKKLDNKRYFFNLIQSIPMNLDGSLSFINYEDYYKNRIEISKQLMLRCDSLYLESPSVIASTCKICKEERDRIQREKDKIRELYYDKKTTLDLLDLIDDRGIDKIEQLIKNIKESSNDKDENGFLDSTNERKPDFNYNEEELKNIEQYANNKKITLKSLIDSIQSWLRGSKY